LGDLFAKNKVELIETHDSLSASILVDKDELIQALTNLLRNSLQSVCENKNAKIRKVFIRSHCEGGLKLYIDIGDTGVGISEKNKDLLFKNQFTTKSKEEGTGLGLSISRRFIRNFNGDLYLLRSDQGLETIFRVELPLVLNGEGTEVAA